MSKQTITITRTISNTEKDFISLRLRLNRAEFVEVRLTLENFALAITGRAETPCEAEIRTRG